MSSFEIYGQIGDSKADYDLDVYIDKNGDGIYSEIPGEEYELYYSSINSNDNKIIDELKNEIIKYKENGISKEEILSLIDKVYDGGLDDKD